MDNNEARTLLEKYRTGECTQEEKQLVEQWFAELAETGEWQWTDGQKEEVQQRMETRLLQQINTPGARLYIQRAAMWWAAAVVLLLLGAGYFFLFVNKKAAPAGYTHLPQQERFRNDIAPAKQQVILTLPDGSKKAVDSIINGAVTLQGMQAVKMNGTLTYSSSSEVVYNTIATEKGRLFHLQLSDGTQVWLDALSSIRFPTSFGKGPREVQVTGQVYFEVAHLSSNTPFLVKSGEQIVEVLGTHFNVNSYDLQRIQTTLLEGSVRVSGNQSAIGPDSHREQSAKNAETSVVLKPGEQAELSRAHSPLTIRHSPDLEEIMAWKNGRFQFNGNTVHQIMDQLQRWYNIEVEYKDTITETFVADIKRDLPVSQLLTLLEMTKQIKFVVEGNKVTVIKP
ncbi:MAG TPA: FecR domain-containing protein [Niastella sp.]